MAFTVKGGAATAKPRENDREDAGRGSGVSPGSRPTPAMPPVGSTARRTRTVSRRDIELFTQLTGDRNPLHYDEELAGSTRFGGLIVQGGVTSGLLNAVVVEDLPRPGSVFLRVGVELPGAGTTR